MSSSSNTPRTSGSHPIGPEKKRRPWWLLLLAAIVAIVLLLLLLTRCGGDDDTSSGSASSTGASSSASPSSSSTTESSPSSSPSTSSSASDTATAAPSSAAPSAAASASPGAATGGALVAGSTPLLPLSAAAPDGSLRSYVGQQVTATSVQVLSVPADEGFWVGTSDTDRVWVQIIGSGESPYQVQVGDLVDFTGSMVKHARGFADRVGVDDQEGGQLLTQQQAHVAAQQSTLTLAAG